MRLEERKQVKLRRVWYGSLLLPSLDVIKKERIGVVTTT
jgi:hypothetical protein